LNNVLPGFNWIVGGRRVDNNATGMMLTCSISVPEVDTWTSDDGANDCDVVARCITA